MIVFSVTCPGRKPTTYHMSGGHHIVKPNLSILNSNNEYCDIEIGISFL